MELYILDAYVKAGIDKKYLSSIRFPKLQRNKTYVMKVWRRSIQDKAVKFLGYGYELCSLIENIPHGMKTIPGTFFFFETNDEEIISILHYEGKYLLSSPSKYDRNILDVSRVTMSCFDKHKRLLKSYNKKEKSYEASDYKQV